MEIYQPNLEIQGTFPIDAYFFSNIYHEQRFFEYGNWGIVGTTLKKADLLECMNRKVRGILIGVEIRDMTNDDGEKILYIKTPSQLHFLQ